MTTMPDLPSGAKTAFATIQKASPAEAKALAEYIKELKNQGSIVALGTDEAFALKDDSGAIRAFKQRVRLSEEAGTLVQIGSKGPTTISAQGYAVLAEASGTCVMCPPEVLVDGQPKSNPFVVRDPDNKRILYIYTRAVAFRYSSKGIPQVSDHTTIFDLPAYRLIELLGKAQYNKQAFKLLPVDMPKPEEKGTWARYPFDECTSLWINTQHDEALKWYALIMNREKKAIDFAQTFAKRNAVKHLLGLQKAPGPVWDVPVICWRSEGGGLPQLSPATYAVVQKQSGGLASGAPVALPGHEATPQAMEITHTTSRADEPEEMHAVMDEEDKAEDEAMEQSFDQETGEVPDPEATEEPAEEPSCPELKNLAVARGDFPDEFTKACKEISLDPDRKDFSPEEAVKIAGRINAILDRG